MGPTQHGGQTRDTSICSDSGFWSKTNLGSTPGFKLSHYVTLESPPSPLSLHLLVSGTGTIISSSEALLQGADKTVGIQCLAKTRRRKRHPQESSPRVALAPRLLPSSDWRRAVLQLPVALAVSSPEQLPPQDSSLFAEGASNVQIPETSLARYTGSGAGKDPNLGA